MHKFWKLNDGWCSAPYLNMAELVFDLLNDPDLLSYSDNGKTSMEECCEICSGKYPWFFIFSNRNELIGLTALLRSDGENAEVCLMIKKGYRKKGIGSEVLNRLSEVAYMSFGLKRLYVRILKNNNNSLRFFEKNGFLKTESIPEQFKVKNEKNSTYFKRELKGRELSLSVVIPTHNSEKWIIDCLRSLSDIQCEIVIVDDDSSDNTVKLVEKYIDIYHNIILIPSKHRIFAGGCRNIGMRHSSGEYIFFLDSDDTLFSIKMFRLMQKAAVLSNADIIKSTEAEYNSDKRYVRNFGRHYTGIIDDNNRPQAFSEQIPVWMCFFRKRFLLDNDIQFAENVLSYEDNYYTFCVAALIQSVVTIPGILTSHRVRSDSLSYISDIEIQKSFLKVAEQQYDFAQRKGLLDSMPDTMERCFFHSVFPSALYASRVVGDECGEIVAEAVNLLKEFFPMLYDHLDRYNLKSEMRDVFEEKWIEAN